MSQNANHHSVNTSNTVMDNSTSSHQSGKQTEANNSGRGNTFSPNVTTNNTVNRPPKARANKRRKTENDETPNLSNKPSSIEDAVRTYYILRPQKSWVSQKWEVELSVLLSFSKNVAKYCIYPVKIMLSDPF